jgi:hypothetical protein
MFVDIVDRTVVEELERLKKDFAEIWGCRLELESREYVGSITGDAIGDSNVSGCQKTREKARGRRSRCNGSESG